MASRTPPPDPAKPMVDENGVMSEQVRLWTRNITSAAPIIGNGNPEGLVVAEQGTSFIDEDAAPGSVLYIKQKDVIGGDRTLGWVLIG